MRVRLADSGWGGGRRLVKRAVGQAFVFTKAGLGLRAGDAAAGSTINGILGGSSSGAGSSNRARKFAQEPERGRELDLIQARRLDA